MILLQHLGVTVDILAVAGGLLAHSAGFERHWACSTFLHARAVRLAHNETALDLQWAESRRAQRQDAAGLASREQARACGSGRREFGAARCARAATG